MSLVKNKEVIDFIKNNNLKQLKKCCCVTEAQRKLACEKIQESENWYCKKTK